MPQEARMADMDSCGRSAGSASSAPVSAAFSRENILRVRFTVGYIYGIITGNA